MIIARATVELNNHKFAAANTILTNALTLYPGHYPLTMLYAQSLLSNGQADKARRLLRDEIRDRDSDPSVYKLYARAAGESGYPIDAHQALAEFYYLSGETGTAVKQLTLAKKQLDKNDQRHFYQAARIDARLKELKKELDQIENQ